MPRYVFETRPIDETERDRVMTLAAQRFPELGIEHQSTLDHDGPAVWTCETPHQSHLLRWAAAAGIELSSVAGRDLLSIPVALRVADGQMIREEVL